MKVVRMGLASIGVVLALGGFGPLSAAEPDPNCNEQYLLCLNAASQKEGFWERTWAEQRCNAAWYACVKKAIGVE